MTIVALTPGDAMPIPDQTSGELRAVQKMCDKHIAQLTEALADSETGMVMNRYRGATTGTVMARADLVVLQCAAVGARALLEHLRRRQHDPAKGNRSARRRKTGRRP